MSILEKWFIENIVENYAPLFDEEGLVVKTFLRGTQRKLKRHDQFDNLMIRTVEEGLLSDKWEGFIYIMFKKENNRIIPIYIGKAERKGINNPISYNIQNIRKNQHAFGRWGYGLAYHIGDLSHAIFNETAYKKPDKKYKVWAEKLLICFEPPTLKEKVYVGIISWYEGMKGPSGLVGSVPSVEKEVIALASVEHSDTLLNVDGI